MKIKIYDCITFFQSNLLFELRFHELKNIVDHFVICEATKTHMGQPKKIISIDFQHPEIFGGNINEVYRICSDLGIEYEFKLENTLECEIEQCDLLFIDTWHDYLQLKSEMYRHHSKVNKYIILHDTCSFGFKDEDLYSEYNMGRKESNLPKGLILAVDEFLLHNPQWFIFERFANNNGITILKRK